jgi:3-hydroxybutyryl-CoA dehydrogenase
MRVEDINLIGVMGGGVMGGGIAQVCAVGGLKVVVRDLTEDLLAKTREGVVEGRFGLRRGVEREKISRQEMGSAIANLTFTTEVEDLRNADLVIEAIPEDLELKKKVFAELDTLIKSDAIFATNTSGFSVSDLNKAVARKDRFLGMHWFSPASVMRLIEIVHAPETSEEAITTLEALGEKVGKVTIRVKDAPGEYGFVANRIYFAAVAEARRVMEEGVASVDDINKAMRFGFNWPVGPLEMAAGTRKGFQ